MTEKETTQKKREADRLKNGGYIEAVGRRKRSTARVRIYTASGDKTAEHETGFMVNDTPAQAYFTTRYYETVLSPLEKVDALTQFSVSAHVQGGGTTGQAEAIRMGLARALEAFEPSWRGKLKRAGFLTRDPREKERKKYGLKKARRAPQWQKR